MTRELHAYGGAIVYIVHFIIIYHSIILLGQMQTSSQHPVIPSSHPGYMTPKVYINKQAESPGIGMPEYIRAGDNGKTPQSCIPRVSD